MVIQKNFEISKKNCKKFLHFEKIFDIVYKSMTKSYGSLAQLVELLPYKQGVIGSSPIASTIKLFLN